MAPSRRLSLMEREELQLCVSHWSSPPSHSPGAESSPCRVNSRTTTPRPPSIELEPFTTGLFAGPITRGSPGSSPFSSVCRRGFQPAHGHAGPPNRLYGDCHSGLLTSRRCGSRMKPSIPIPTCDPAAQSSGSCPISAQPTWVSSPAQGAAVVSAYSGPTQH